jgi:hypothetical protein
VTQWSSFTSTIASCSSASVFMLSLLPFKDYLFKVLPTSLTTHWLTGMELHHSLGLTIGYHVAVHVTRFITRL